MKNFNLNETFTSVVRFSNGKERSVVGFNINFKNLTLEITPISGKAPHANDVCQYLLLQTPFLDVLNAEVKRRGNAYRVHPIKIVRYEGLSGAIEYKLFVRERIANSSFSSSRMAAKLHISMYGKLNEGFGDKFNQMYILDAADILVAVGMLDRNVLIFHDKTCFLFALTDKFVNLDSSYYEELNAEHFLSSDDDGFELIIADTDLEGITVHDFSHSYADGKPVIREFRVVKAN